MSLQQSSIPKSLNPILSNQQQSGDPNKLYGEEVSAEKIIAGLTRDIKSIQKTRDSYIEKYGPRRFSRMNRRVWRSKLEDIVDLVAPSMPRDGKTLTKKKRRELAIRAHQLLKAHVYQSTLPFVDDVSSSLAEIVPFHPVSIRQKIKEQVCPELDRQEKEFGGSTRAMMKRRRLFGCDAPLD